MTTPVTGQVYDKVKDLKECQEKHGFLEMLCLDDGRDSLEVIDDYIAQLDRELDDMIDADYSILPTDDNSNVVMCDACTYAMSSRDELKRHASKYHPGTANNALLLPRAQGSFPCFIFTCFKGLFEIVGVRLDDADLVFLKVDFS